VVLEDHTAHPVADLEPRDIRAPLRSPRHPEEARSLVDRAIGQRLSSRPEDRAADDRLAANATV
jgi:hypothetical protein